MNAELVKAEALLAGRRVQIALELSAQAAKREARKARRAAAKALVVGKPVWRRYRKKRV